MLRRHRITKRFYQDALEISSKKEKKLMVIGDPCRGTYFRFVSKYFPPYEFNILKFSESKSKNRVFNFNYLELVFFHGA